MAAILSDQYSDFVIGVLYTITEYIALCHYGIWLFSIFLPEEN